jgi:drug/metabolite transporter (DMT)-like permease
LRALWHHKSAIAAFAVTELVFPFSLIALAESWLSSAMTGILVATVPLTVVVIAPLFGIRETLSARRLGGLIVGFAGVIALLGFDAISGSRQWLAVACLAIAIIGYAAGPLVVQRHLASVDSIGALAVSLVVASLVLLPFAINSRPQGVPSARSLVCILILGVICTACAMLLYFHVIHAAGAARASIVAYVSPAIAAVLGVGILHEHFGVGTAAGLALILLGSAYGSSGSHNQPAAPDAQS